MYIYMHAHTYAGLTVLLQALKSNGATALACLAAAPKNLGKARMVVSVIYKPLLEYLAFRGSRNVGSNIAPLDSGRRIPRTSSRMQGRRSGVSERKVSLDAC